MLDVIIVDDESLARERLNRQLDQLGYEVTGQAENAEEAWQLINELDPSIVLLDIEMPGETGLELAERAFLLENPPAIIFTTAYDQYALEAFSAFAIAYLLKPIKQAKLQQALNQACTINKAQLSSIESNTVKKSPKPSAQPRHITANSHRGIDLIPVESVRCLLADSKYITIVSTDGEFLIDGTLKNMEAEFTDSFIRIHRNALVSAEHILGLVRAPEGHYTVKLKDIELQPVVSRRYASKVKAFLNAL